jgi:hypothetical protein
MIAENFLARLPFSSRLQDIERRLAELAESENTLGSVAPMFGGGPVRGSRGIDSEFATAGRAKMKIREITE